MSSVSMGQSTPSTIALFDGADWASLTKFLMHDCKGAAALLDSPPQAKELLADKGYGADWFLNALSRKGITPCIPGKRSWKEPEAYKKKLYKQRYKIEIMFGRFKDWRRIATRYGRYAYTFFFAICIVAIVIFYI